MIDKENMQQVLAYELIANTNSSFFLTGRAGTGKTTFLRNVQKMELIQKRDYDKVFRNEAFIRQESEQMVKDYLTGVMKTQRICAPVEQIAEQAQTLISGCYKSFLDPDFNTRLTQILPKLEQR